MGTRWAKDGQKMVNHVFFWISIGTPLLGKLLNLSQRALPLFKPRSHLPQHRVQATVAMEEEEANLTANSGLFDFSILFRPCLWISSLRGWYTCSRWKRDTYNLWNKMEQVNNMDSVTYSLRNTSTLHKSFMWEVQYKPLMTILGFSLQCIKIHYSTTRQAI